MQAYNKFQAYSPSTLSESTPSPHIAPLLLPQVLSFKVFFNTSLNDFIVYGCICATVCVVYVSVIVSGSQPTTSQLLFFNHAHPSNQTQVLRNGSKHSYLPDHFASPFCYFLTH